MQYGMGGRGDCAAAARLSALLSVADEPIQLRVAGLLCTHVCGAPCSQVVEAGPVRDITT